MNIYFILSFIHHSFIIHFIAISGLPISGTVFTSDVQYIVSEGTVTFTVGWDIGTDVLYTIDFGDGSEPYEWDWQVEGHTESYGALR